MHEVGSNQFSRIPSFFFPVIKDVVTQWEFVQILNMWFISLKVGIVLYAEACFESYIINGSKFASKKI